MIAGEKHKEFIRANIPRWQSLLKDLIRTPSLFENEHKVVKLVEQYIKKIGGRAERVYHNPELLCPLSGSQPPISAVPGRYSLAVRTGGKNDGRSLAVNTHLDTVSEGDLSAWNHPPYKGYIDRKKNIIYGRGSMDDKAGVVISLAVMETIIKNRMELNGEVVFHYVLEDENTGNGTLLCLEAGYLGDGAVIIDGTRPDRLINQQAGNMEFEVMVTGSPASVSVSHLGVNAAEMMARLLLHLREAVSALNQSRQDPWTRFPSPFQLVIHKIKSEGFHLVVPELAVAGCYLTFPPPYSLAGMKEFLSERVGIFNRKYRLPDLPELKWTGFASEPVQSNSSELEQIMRKSAANLGMEPIDAGPSTGISDMRHFCAYGIPCVLYGPGSGFNPHRPNEHYQLDDLPGMILFYLDFISRWCT